MIGSHEGIKRGECDIMARASAQSVVDEAGTNRWRDADCLNLLAELRGLAADSLQLLRAALFDARFPAMFELPVYGSIIGMFELNNLGAAPPPCQKHLTMHTWCVTRI